VGRKRQAALHRMRRRLVRVRRTESLLVAISVSGSGQSSHSAQTAGQDAGPDSVPLAIPIHPESLAVEQLLLKWRAHRVAVVVQLDHVQTIALQRLQRLRILECEKNNIIREIFGRGIGKKNEVCLQLFK